MVDLRRRGGRLLAVASAVMLSGLLVAVRPAAALSGDTITDPSNGGGAMEMQQAMRAVNAGAGTMTITVQNYAPFTDDQTYFNISIGTAGSGPADIWIPIRFDTTTNAIFAGIGLAGSFHLSPVTVSRPAA